MMNELAGRSGGRIWLAAFVVLAAVMPVTWLGGPSSAELGVAPTPVPTPGASQYTELEQMRLPWDSRVANPRYLTDDPAGHWTRQGAIGLAWDFAQSSAPTPTPIAGTDILAPASGVVLRTTFASGTCEKGNYGNLVEIGTDAGWSVLLAHLQDNSRVKPEYRGYWIPRGVPIGRLGNTGRGTCPYANHIHLELRWHGAAPPSVEGMAEQAFAARLPADARPFGLGADALSAAHGYRSTQGNQKAYRPSVLIVWPYDGTVIPWDRGEVPDQQARVILQTQEMSSLHEFRWQLRRRDTGDLVAEATWQQAPLVGPSLHGVYYHADVPLARLGRGDYSLTAQARFPNIREGEEPWQPLNASQEVVANFTVLDLSVPTDWLRWQLMRIFVKPAYAALEGPQRPVPDRLGEIPPALEVPSGPPALPLEEPESGGLPIQSGGADEAIAVVRALASAIDRQDVDAAIGTLRPQDQLLPRLLAGIGKPLLQQSGVDIDFGELQYEVLDQGDAGTVVRVTGKAILRSTEDGSTIDEFDEYYVDVPVVKFLGRWYVYVDLAKFLSAMLEQ